MPKEMSQHKSWIFSATKVAEWRRGNPEWFQVWRNWVIVALIMRWVEIYFVFFMPSIRMKLWRSAGIGLLLGVLQWLIIRKRVGKGSILWVIVTWGGYMIAALVAYTTFGVIEQRFLELRPGFTEYDVVAVIFYLYWLVEALVIGVLQSLSLSKWTKYAWRWMIVLVVAVSIEFLIIYPTGAMVMLLTGIPIFGHIIVTFVMFLAFSMTGAVLVELLKTYRKMPPLA